MATHKPITAYELKYRVQGAGHDSHFFDRASMRFFGDTMKNYGVRSKPLEIVTCSGQTVIAWELYRRNPVKHGLFEPAFFDVETYRRVSLP